TPAPRRSESRRAWPRAGGCAAARTPSAGARNRVVRGGRRTSGDCRCLLCFLPPNQAAKLSVQRGRVRNSGMDESLASAASAGTHCSAARVSEYSLSDLVVLSADL